MRTRSGAGWKKKTEKTEKIAAEKNNRHNSILPPHKTVFYFNSCFSFSCSFISFCTSSSSYFVFFSCYFLCCVSVCCHLPFFLFSFSIRNLRAKTDADCDVCVCVWVTRKKKASQKKRKENINVIIQIEKIQFRRIYEMRECVMCTVCVFLCVIACVSNISHKSIANNVRRRQSTHSDTAFTQWCSSWWSCVCTNALRFELLQTHDNPKIDRKCTAFANFVGSFVFRFPFYRSLRSAAIKTNGRSRTLLRRDKRLALFFFVWCVEWSINFDE